MPSSTRKETSGARGVRRQHSESAATTLPVETPTKKNRPAEFEVFENGLKLGALEDGTLRFEFEASGTLFSWTMDTAGRLTVVSGSANMPLSLHWSLLRDARRSTLEEAAITHTKRIKAYAQRRFQVDRCGQWIKDGKIETAGACNYVQVDLNVVARDELGRLRLGLWYDDFSMHPVRSAFFADGSPAFREAVTEKWEDVKVLLMSQPLDKVCRVLCATR